MRQLIFKILRRIMFKMTPGSVPREIVIHKGGRMADAEPTVEEPEKPTALTVITPPSATMVVPVMVADLGDAAALRFIDFFTANIRSPNTRAAYAVAVRSFFSWLETRGVRELSAVRTHHVSAYVEALTRSYKAPTVKQHLAAIRMLFDWLIVGQVVGQNPAAAVRGPKHVVKKGKTPVLDGDEARKLLDSIDCRWRCSRSSASTGLHEALQERPRDVRRRASCRCCAACQGFASTICSTAAPMCLSAFGCSTARTKRSPPMRSPRNGLGTTCWSS
jgi:hypothetical protein